MAKYIKSDWIPGFWTDKPYFLPVSLFSDALIKFQEVWPTLSAYQHIIESTPVNINTKSGLNLRIVPQDAKPDKFYEHYAPRIYLTGEMQTRTDNWHDFFQVISWLLFPKSKSVINSRHYFAALERHKLNMDKGCRSAQENLFSLFDECGAVVLSTDATLLDNIREHQWKELFWNRRTDASCQLQCYIFGHAMNEKLINPYIGMTANCLMLEVTQDILSLPLHMKIKYIDKVLSQQLEDDREITSPHQLSPLPVLGLPGWHPDNTTESFYNNTNYFR